MPGYLIAFFAAMFLASSALAQDESPADVAAQEKAAAEDLTDEEALKNASENAIEEVAEAEKAAAEDESEAEEDADLDQQTYEEDDDDFVPTEEIPVGEATQFPTNI